MFIAQRFARDLTDGYVNWQEKFWWPEKQVGTPWFASGLTNGLLAIINLDNDKLEKVQVLAWIFLIQLVLCCFAYVVACAGCTSLTFLPFIRFLRHKRLLTHFALCLSYLF